MQEGRNHGYDWSEGLPRFSLSVLLFLFIVFVLCKDSQLAGVDQELFLKISAIEDFLHQLNLGNS